MLNGAEWINEEDEDLHLGWPEGKYIFIKTMCEFLQFQVWMCKTSHKMNKQQNWY